MIYRRTRSRSQATPEGGGLEGGLKQTAGHGGPKLQKSMGRLTVAPPPPSCKLRGSDDKKLARVGGEVEPPLAALLGAQRLNR